MRFLKIWPIILGIGIFLGDQIIKRWVENHPLFISKNSSFVFGYVRNLNITIWLILFLFLIILIVFVSRQRIRPKNILPLALIFAGAASNFYDRLFRGAVIDYFHIQNLLFNLADLSIIIGTILYGYQTWVFKSKKS